MSNLDNKNKNILVDNIIVFFLFTVFLFFKSLKILSRIFSYGCGDSFAAGILYGMASKWDIDKSLNLAKVMGRNASEFFGPYSNCDEK